MADDARAVASETGAVLERSIWHGRAANAALARTELLALRMLGQSRRAELASTALRRLAADLDEIAGLRARARVAHQEALALQAEADRLHPERLLERLSSPTGQTIIDPQAQLHEALSRRLSTEADQLHEAAVRRFQDAATELADFRPPDPNQWLFDVVSWVPGVGDVIDALRAVRDLRDHPWAGAATLGVALVPGPREVVEVPGQYLARHLALKASVQTLSEASAREAMLDDLRMLAATTVRGKRRTTIELADESDIEEYFWTRVAPRAAPREFVTEKGDILWVAHFGDFSVQLRSGSRSGGVTLDIFDTDDVVGFKKVHTPWRQR
ncbi:MAG: hypothetical protein ACTHOD_03560 [Motilibacteraceae bacterium]